MENQSISENFKSLFTMIMRYIISQYKFARLDAVEKLVIISSLTAVTVIILFVITLFMFFVSFALAYYLGSVWNDTYLGFLFVAGLYILLGLFLFALRKPLIINPIQHIILKVVFKTDKDDDE